MTTIDSISLGGNSATGDPYQSAIALHLTKLSPISSREQIDGWSLELRRGSGFVVARNLNALDRDEVLGEGYERVERFLDITSFELAATLEIGAPGRNHIILYKREGKRVMERLMTADMPISVNVKITTLGTDGKPLPEADPLPPKWIPALRSYRLSQASHSPYEAYRNLWLGLETLLSAAVPLRHKEKEGAWLRRAFAEVITDMDLSHEFPENVDPVDYLMTEHYEEMRCNLFHAKVAVAQPTSSLPSVAAAVEAYAQLVRVWRAVATHVGMLRFTGSGIMTYVGYAMHMNTVFSRLTFHATEDPTVPTAADTKISPAGQKIVDFDSSSHVGMDAPGLVKNIGVIDLTSSGQLPIFFRIATSIEGGALYNVDYLTGGLDVNGVDRFEYHQNWRLHNTGSPRQHFD